MKILYFGIFDPTFSRNKIYAEGLRQNGVKVIVCTDTGKGFRKFWNLFRKHHALVRAAAHTSKPAYDAIIVGFPGYIIVPFARLIKKRGVPLIFDALCSFYETQIVSRNAYQGNPFRIVYVRMIDWLATRCADKILLETEHQKKYFVHKLGVRPEKCIVTYTGVDDSQLYADESVKKSDRFTVLFRGRITREAGAVHVLRAAKLLEKENIQFLIIGFGWGDAVAEFNAVMAELKPANVKHISKQLPPDELRALMLPCHASLGQFENNERLRRTIPHKAFEALVMKLPYVTARAEGISEILTDGENCLMVAPANPKDLASKIKMLRDDRALAEKLADNGFALYTQVFAPKVIVQPIIDELGNL